MVATGLAQPGGHCDEVPGYRRSGDVDCIEALYRMYPLVSDDSTFIDRRLPSMEGI